MSETGRDDGCSRMQPVFICVYDSLPPILFERHSNHALCQKPHNNVEEIRDNERLDKETHQCHLTTFKMQLGLEEAFIFISRGKKIANAEISIFFISFQFVHRDNLTVSVRTHPQLSIAWHYIHTIPFFFKHSFVFITFVRSPKYTAANCARTRFRPQ